MPLLWISLAFLSGLFLGEALPWSGSTWLAISASCLLIWPMLRFFPRRLPLAPGLNWLGTTQPKLRVPPILLLFFFFIGAARIAFAIVPDIQNGHIAAWNDKGQISIQGIVTSFPDRRDKSTLLHIRVESITLVDSSSTPMQPKPAHGLVQVLLPANAGWQYGDRLILTGKPVTPPENEEFSYRQYLARQDIFTYLPYPRTRLINHSAGSPFITAIYRFRDWAFDEIHHLFPDPEASLLAGILLGIETGLTPALQRAFQDTGTAHIIAISGFNITIIIEMISRLFGKILSRWWAALAAISTVAIYTILVGASPSVVRAAIMGSLALIATQIGRRNTAYNSLALAAGIMACISPRLPWDAGFQLSFAATLGLILFGEPLQTGFTSFLERRISIPVARSVSKPVGEYFLLTLAAQLVTMPIILYHFGRLSLSALIANPLILPVQPLLMTLSGLAVLSGLIADPLAHLLAWASWPLPAYTIRVVEAIASHPGGVLIFGDMSFGAVLLLYAAIFTPSLVRRFTRHWVNYLRPGFIFIGLVLLTVVVWRGVFTRPDGYMHLTIFDLDNSQALFIRGPGGQNILINGGHSSGLLSDALGRRLSPFDRRLDALVINSAFAGDLSALTTVLERYPAELTLWGSFPKTRTAESLVEYLKQNHLDTQALETGEVLAITPEIQLKVLAVTEEASALLLQWNNFRVLIPSGIPPGQLNQMDRTNLSLLILTSKDLKSTSSEQWSPLTAQAIIYTASEGELPGSQGSWLNTLPGGWFHITTDGVNMWIEEGK